LYRYGSDKYSENLDASVQGGASVRPTDHAKPRERVATRKTSDPLFNSGTRPGEHMTWWQMAASKRKDIKLAAIRAFSATKEEGVFGLDIESGLDQFVDAVINAFFDNDLFHSVRRFLTSARGSFGLGITCSLDAGRQMVVAARGQTISVAFYPKLGLVLYGSEQAAVKAGLGLKAPPGSDSDAYNEELGPAMRIDLDDLGGEAGMNTLKCSQPITRKRLVTTLGRYIKRCPGFSSLWFHIQLVPLRLDHAHRLGRGQAAAGAQGGAATAQLRDERRGVPCERARGGQRGGAEVQGPAGSAGRGCYSCPACILNRSVCKPFCV
jgi:hypothetical protein